MREMLQVPRLSLQERDRRWSAIRSAMSAEQIDCLIIWGYPAHYEMKVANARYVTQMGGNGEMLFVVFPLAAPPTVFTWASTMLDWWRTVQDWVEDIQFRSPSWSGSIARRIKELGLEKGRIGVVGLPGLSDRDGWLPYQTYMDITAALPEVTFVNATALVERVRIKKSQEELSFLEKAGELADIVFEQLMQTAKPGVKECVCYAKMIETLISNGGEYPTLLLWHSGREPFPHPGRFPSTRALDEGDLIVIEFHSKYGGYLTHHERTIAIGEPRQEYRYMYDTCLKCINDAAAKLYPGVKFSELEAAIRNPIREAGLGYVEAGVHGHGLESLEYPSFVFPPGRAASELVSPQVEVGTSELEAGMVVAINADLMNPSWKDGKTGTMLAETYVVTESGPHRFSKASLEFLVVRTRL